MEISDTINMKVYIHHIQISNSYLQNGTEIIDETQSE